MVDFKDIDISSLTVEGLDTKPMNGADFENLKPKIQGEQTEQSAEERAQLAAINDPKTRGDLDAQQTKLSGAELTQKAEEAYPANRLDTPRTELSPEALDAAAAKMDPSNRGGSDDRTKLSQADLDIASAKTDPENHGKFEVRTEVTQEQRDLASSKMDPKNREKLGERTELSAEDLNAAAERMSPENRGGTQSVDVGDIDVSKISMAGDPEVSSANSKSWETLVASPEAGQAKLGR